MTSHRWNVDDGTFHLGINMAGAISAGAYTAGALDFLLQALDEWKEAKKSPSANTPRHRVCIDAFSGASAGGMCAAIAAVMVQQDTVDHIHNAEDPKTINTNNRFYESWVNKIDMDSLLQHQDVQTGQPVVSLLDSTIIDEIADYALVPPVPLNPPCYISESLTLFLTLTNVRGVPYSLNGLAEGSAEEDIACYADKLEFEVVPKQGSKTESSLAVPLPAGGTGPGWDTLKAAAKATGAFPLFLAPRKLTRRARDYYFRPWMPNHSAHPCSYPPHWPLNKDDAFETLNIDGGVTDNDPFQLAHDFLVSRNPLAIHTCQNPREPDKANCAVLTIAPFTDDTVYDEKFNVNQSSSVFRILPKLFAALISQSRFQGESLTLISGDKSSRFVIAPSKADRPGKDALQCSLLGAFGGFFERGFRAHDYQLGRRNCQKFLKDHFRLALTNPIIEAGLRTLSEDERKCVISQYDPASSGYLPIIPLCGSAAEEILPPVPAKISRARIKLILNASARRLRRITKPMIEEIFGSNPGSFTARMAAYALISTVAKSRLNRYLTHALHHVTS